MASKARPVPGLLRAARDRAMAMPEDLSDVDWRHQAVALQGAVAIESSPGFGACVPLSIAAAAMPDGTAAISRAEVQA